MAAMMVDERAPGVSAAMRRRITAALDAGERPALVGQNLRLGSVVLQRADGRDTPALREVELQMGVATWTPQAPSTLFSRARPGAGAALTRPTLRVKNA